MIHELWIFMAGTGLPLFNKKFGAQRNTLDPGLIAGLLTATRSFADQAIGSELKDLVLEGQRLHSYFQKDSGLLYTVHLDDRVENERVDSYLLKGHQLISEGAKSKDLDINDIEMATFSTFQKFVEIIEESVNPIMKEIDDLRTDLMRMFDETSFDSAQLILLSKIPQLVPILTKSHTSLMIRDLSTNKIHFQQIYSEMEYSKANAIYSMIDNLSAEKYFKDADLSINPGFIIISESVSSVFQIHSLKNNLFIVFKDNFNQENFNNFKKTVAEIKKRIEEMSK